MIHNLSHPEGSSVNDYIPQELATVQYASIQNAISFIKNAETIVFMAKVDIESAFRIIPFALKDTPLLGFKWRDTYYMDLVLPMGCASACSIFEAFSSALEWVAVSKFGASKVVHVIDDFLFMAESIEKCEQDMRSFMDLCAKIGVPLTPGKPDKGSPIFGCHSGFGQYARCQMLLQSFLNRQKVTLTELQSLIGVLNFSCTVIISSICVFLRDQIMSRFWDSF